jgi:galactokinase
VTTTIRAWAPGRVNLIGEHTDYTGGLVLPVAVQWGTTISGHATERLVRLRSDRRDDVLELTLPVDDPTTATPFWGRFVAGAASETGARRGIDGVVSSDLTIGGGLSSSSSLTVAAALALGARGTPLELAVACRRAEQRATGVPCGIMDQLVITSAVAGHALLIDCSTNGTTPIAIPDDLDIVVVDSGQHRSVASSEYASRAAQCAAAQDLIGPLRHATLEQVDTIDDPVVRRRARHVVNENRRVLAFVDALADDDPVRAGEILIEGHGSLRDDFDVSTPELDELVASLTARPDVHGARLTGAGFGGCVVALCDTGTTIEAGSTVRASHGATIEET